MFPYVMILLFSSWRHSTSRKTEQRTPKKAFSAIMGYISGVMVKRKAKHGYNELMLYVQSLNIMMK